MCPPLSCYRPPVNKGGQSEGEAGAEATAPPSLLETSSAPGINTPPTTPTPFENTQPSKSGEPVWIPEAGGSQ